MAEGRRNEFKDHVGGLGSRMHDVFWSLPRNVYGQDTHKIERVLL